MEFLLIAIALGAITLSAFALVNEMMKKDETILMWQNAYAELATENELRKLGVMK